MTNLDSYSKAETLLYQQRSVQSRLFFQWHPTPVLLPGKFHGMEEPGGLYTVHGVAKSRTQLNDFPFTFHFHALEKEMATHSSVPAWRIPGTGGLVGFRLWGRTESDMTEAT